MPHAVPKSSPAKHLRRAVLLRGLQPAPRWAFNPSSFFILTMSEAVLPCQTIYSEYDCIKGLQNGSRRTFLASHGNHSPSLFALFQSFRWVDRSGLNVTISPDAFSSRASCCGGLGSARVHAGANPEFFMDAARNQFLEHRCVEPFGSAFWRVGNGCPANQQFHRQQLDRVQ